MWFTHINNIQQSTSISAPKNPRSAAQKKHISAPPGRHLAGEIVGSQVIRQTHLVFASRLVRKNKSNKGQLRDVPKRPCCLIIWGFIWALYYPIYYDILAYHKPWIHELGNAVHHFSWGVRNFSIPVSGCILHDWFETYLVETQPVSTTNKKLDWLRSISWNLWKIKQQVTLW